MNQMPGRCPICSNTLSVTRLQCGQCGTAIEGLFGLGRFQALSPEQLQFLEVFVKNRGKLNALQEELDISYPTAAARLDELVRALGYEVDDRDMSDVDRYEFYEAQVLKPQGGPPMGPVPPMHPTPPIHPQPPPMPNPQAKSRLSDEQRQKIMDDWNAGRISADEAVKRLNS